MQRMYEGERIMKPEEIWTYAGFLWDIPVFIDPNIAPDKAYLLNMSEARYSGKKLGLEGEVFLVPNKDQILPEKLKLLKITRDLIR